MQTHMIHNYSVFLISEIQTRISMKLKWPNLLFNTGLKFAHLHCMIIAYINGAEAVKINV